MPTFLPSHHTNAATSPCTHAGRDIFLSVTPSLSRACFCISPRALMTSGLCCMKKSPSCRALLVLITASAALVPIPASPPPLGVKIWELWLKRNEQDLLLPNAGEEEDVAAGLQTGCLRALYCGSTSCLFLMAPGTPGSGANCTSPSYCQ